MHKNWTVAVNHGLKCITGGNNFAAKLQCPEKEVRLEYRRWHLNIYRSPNRYSVSIKVWYRCSTAWRIQEKFINLSSSHPMKQSKANFLHLINAAVLLLLLSIFPLAVWRTNIHLCCTTAEQEGEIKWRAEGWEQQGSANFVMNV